MKNPSPLGIPLQRTMSAPQCRLNCTCKHLREKINQHLIKLAAITEGIALTSYTDDDSLPQQLRDEGKANRKHYLSLLLSTLRDLKNDMMEVHHVEN